MAHSQIFRGHELLKILYYILTNSLKYPVFKLFNNVFTLNLYVYNFDILFLRIMSLYICQCPFVDLHFYGCCYPCYSYVCTTYIELNVLDALNSRVFLGTGALNPGFFVFSQ